MKIQPRILFEIQPTRYKEKLVRELETVKKLTRRIHIPDAPLGYPKAHVLSLASLAVNRMFEVTIHLRVIDLNENALINTIYGAQLIGVKRILFLRGDKPTYGKPCPSVSPEEAIRIARSDPRLNSVHKGLILSLRFPAEKIVGRVREAQPDFVLTMNNEISKLRVLRENYDGTIVSYMVVRTPYNRGYLEKYQWARDVVDLHDVKERIHQYSKYVDEVLLTAPKSVDKLVEAWHSIP